MQECADYEDADIEDHLDDFEFLMSEVTEPQYDAGEGVDSDIDCNIDAESDIEHQASDGCEDYAEHKRRLMYGQIVYECT